MSRRATQEAAGLAMSHHSGEPGPNGGLLAAVLGAQSDPDRRGPG